MILYLRELDKERFANGTTKMHVFEVGFRVHKAEDTMPVGTYLPAPSASLGDADRALGCKGNLFTVSDSRTPVAAESASSSERIEDNLGTLGTR